MSCQRCSGVRIVKMTAKCSDMCNCSMVNDSKKETDGYVPRDMNIGGGDYVEFSFCLDCGQIQADFPVTETELERHVPASIELCPKCDSKSVFEYRKKGQWLCHCCGRVFTTFMKEDNK